MPELAAQVPSSAPLSGRPVPEPCAHLLPIIPRVVGIEVHIHLLLKPSEQSLSGTGLQFSIKFVPKLIN